MRPGSVVLRLALVVGWLILLGVGLGLCPAGDGRDGQRVLTFFQLGGEPLAAAIFNGLGVWPLVALAVLVRDPPQRVPTWPFAAASMVAGAYVLIPGLVLRRWGTAPREHPGVVRRALSGPVLGGVLTAATVGLIGFACTGSWASYADLLRTSTLVWAMSVDFVALCALWPVLLVDDARRYDARPWKVALGLVPLLGPPLWLTLRAAGASPQIGSNGPPGPDPA